MQIRSIRRLRNFSDKTFFLRVDLNVPIADGKIVEDYKIKASLDTLRFLLEKGAKVVIVSHLGEPDGPDKAHSLKPVATRLSRLLGQRVKFLPDGALSPKTVRAVEKLGSGQAALLENIRFYEAEYDNDVTFAKELSSLADIYVNDAFAVSHRNQASVSGISEFIPSYAGLLLENEIKAMERIVKPKKPLVIIMGGAKIKTKLPLILKLKGKASRILIGGGLANTFFKYQGLTVGKSLVDKEGGAYLNKLFKGSRIDSKILLPKDVVVKTSHGKVRAVSPDSVKKTEDILDIGPKTINDFAAYIKKAKTLVWNGPLGFFEDRRFKHGTISIAMLLAARSSGRAYGLVGGGETVEALKMSRMSQYVDWVSTGGGATLAYLGGVKLPGLKNIVKA